MPDPGLTRPAGASLLPMVPARVLQSVLEAGRIPLVSVARGRIVAVNAAAEMLLGAPAAQWVGRPTELLAPPGPTHPLQQPGWLAVLPVDRTETFECLVRRADGRPVPVAVHAWRDTASGAAEGVACLALIDTEQRRDAERRTSRAQASLRRVIETAPLAIAVFEMPQRRLLEANQTAEQFFGLPLAHLVGRSPSQWPAGTGSHEVSVLEASLDLAVESPPGVRREIVAGSDAEALARVWDTRFVSIATDEAGAGTVEQTQVLLVANEVTDLRAAEQERFDAAIAQRGLLVQEVHHRIKNNLQGVAGLLQQAAHRYPEVAPLLSEAVGQLNAIAQVYGLQVGSGGPVELAGLLRAVTRSVERTFSRTVIEKLSALSWTEARSVERTLSRTIGFDVAGQEPERWRLPEAEAIPVALTVNELLTNALKHGGGHPVRCTLLADAASVVIEIVNHGRLREGYDQRSRGSGPSGLGLVRALLPRRSAELSLTQDGEQVVTRVLLRPPAVRKDG